MSEEAFADRESLVSTFFPMGDEAKSQTLEFLETDPDLMKVAHEIALIDKALWDTLGYMIDGWRVPQDLQQDFTDGFCVTYVAFKAQAQEASMALPITAEDVAQQYFEQLDASSPVSDAYFRGIMNQVEHADNNFPDMFYEYVASDANQERSPQERTAFVYGGFALYDFLEQHYTVLDDQPRPTW